MGLSSRNLSVWKCVGIMGGSQGRSPRPLSQLLSPSFFGLWLVIRVYAHHEIKKSTHSAQTHQPSASICRSTLHLPEHGTSSMRLHVYILLTRVCVFTHARVFVSGEPFFMDFWLFFTIMLKFFQLTVVVFTCTRSSQLKF